MKTLFDAAIFTLIIFIAIPQSSFADSTSSEICKVTTKNYISYLTRKI